MMKLFGLLADMNIQIIDLSCSSLL